MTATVVKLLFLKDFSLEKPLSQNNYTGINILTFASPHISACSLFALLQNMSEKTSSFFFFYFSSAWGLFFFLVLGEFEHE